MAIYDNLYFTCSNFSRAVYFSYFSLIGQYIYIVDSDWWKSLFCKLFFGGAYIVGLFLNFYLSDLFLKIWLIKVHKNFYQKFLFLLWIKKYFVCSSVYTRYATSSSQWGVIYFAAGTLWFLFTSFIYLRFLYLFKKRFFIYFFK